MKSSPHSLKFYLLLGLLCVSHAMAQRAPSERTPISQEQFDKTRADQSSARFDSKRLEKASLSLQDAIDLLGKKFSYKLKLAGFVDGNQAVKLRRGRGNLGKFLSQIGMRVIAKGESWTVGPIPPGTFVGTASGLQFFAETEAWPGDKSGTVMTFTNDISNISTSDIKVLKVKGRKNRTFESCKIHSPTKIMIRDGQYAIKTVTINTKSWWTHKLDIDLGEDFVNGDKIICGPYTFTINWPNIECTLPEEIPVSMTSGLLQITTSPNPKKSVEVPGDETQSSELPAVDVEQDSAWCGCIEECKNGPARKFEMTSSASLIRYPIVDSKDQDIKAVKSISLQLSLPVSQRGRINLKAPKIDPSSGKSPSKIGITPEFEFPPGVEQRLSLFGDRAFWHKAKPNTITKAVDTGLSWLAQHQSPEGHWDATAFMKNADASKRPLCDGPGSADNTVGVTALALLSYLGAGQSPEFGKHRKTVRKGITWLRSQEDSEGSFANRRQARYTYSHAAATWALVEAYGATKSPTLKVAAQTGIDYIQLCQNEGKGWRYGVATGESDSSATALMVCALYAGKIAGLKVEEKRFQWALGTIDSLTDEETMRTGYLSRGGRPVRNNDVASAFPYDQTESLIALALTTRFFCGQDPKKDPMQAAQFGTQLILKKLPRWDTKAGCIDMYYWYYGCLAMYQIGGKAWTTWQQAFEKSVISKQRNDGHFRGSWDPIGPWGLEGGRVYSTALMILGLETPHRYRPVFGGK